MNTENQKDPKNEDQPGIVYEKQDSLQERPDQPHETELEQPESESDTSFSEEHDVTPPNPHEVSSFGNAETDFVSSGKHGRETSRLLDHEPGL